jgi:hypothetical protein
MMNVPLREQYISEPEMEAIRGLLLYLNQNMSPNTIGISIDAIVTDAGGDHVGVVKWANDEGGYALHFFARGSA